MNLIQKFNSDKKNYITNIGAVMVLIFTIVQQAIITAGDIHLVDWTMVIINTALAVGLWLQGKDNNGKAKKLLLFLIFFSVMPLFQGCAATYKADCVYPAGVDELGDVVNLYYSSCQYINENGILPNTGDLMNTIIPATIASIDNFGMIKCELQEFSDEELQMLVDKADNYNLGLGKGIYKRVCKKLLEILQRRYGHKYGELN